MLEAGREGGATDRGTSVPIGLSARLISSNSNSNPQLHAKVNDNPTTFLPHGIKFTSNKDDPQQTVTVFGAPRCNLA